MLSSSLAPIPLGDLDMGDSYPDVIWSQACPSVHPHRATGSLPGHWATSASCSRCSGACLCESIRTLGQGLIPPQPCSRVLTHQGWFLEGTRRSPVNGGEAAGFGVRGNIHPFSKSHTAQLSLPKLAADRGSLLPHGGVVTQGITVGRGAFQQPS